MAIGVAWVLALAGAMGAAAGGVEDPPDDRAAGLQAAIDAAADRGVDYLLGSQRRDGSWGYDSYRYLNGQTALCVYALLKSGVSPRHGALQRALLWLDDHPPTETYSAACQLLAYAATREDEWLDRMPAIVDLLLDWQDGIWSYPGSQKDGRFTAQPGPLDLSNTQYAALGLLAAQRVGHKVPKRVWNQLLRGVLDFQERPFDVDGRKVAGFRYRLDLEEEPSTSMTAAGVAVLAICREALGGRITASQRRDVDRALAQGLGWLELNFTVERNVGKDKWHFYWLYGLERVGSFLNLDRIGPHDWYADGARTIVAAQRTDGSWSQLGPEPDTCFAILFLERASAASTGGGPRATESTWLAAAPDSPVRMRGVGQLPLTVWIDGLAPEAAARLRAQDAGGPGSPGSTETRLEYTIDGETVASVVLDPELDWERERWAVRHEFERNGTFRVGARFVGGQGLVLASPEHTLRVDQVLEPWMRAAATARARNLLLGRELEVRASSQSSRGEGPERACDGIEGTRWMSAPRDTEPWIRLELAKPARADTIVLGTVGSEPAWRERYDRITRVALVVNDDSEPIALAVDLEDVRAAVCTLEKRTRIESLEIRVLEFEPARDPQPAEPDRAEAGKWAYAAKPGVGFSEIALELRGR